MRISLLICTSGRPRLLDQALQAIARGTENPDQLVIVNGSDGLTPQIVEKHRDSFEETVLVEHPNRTLAALRNLGLPWCTGDVVALTDDDAVPDRTWVAAIRRAFTDHPEAGAIGGPVRRYVDDFVSRVADTVVFPRPLAGRPITSLPTVNLAYRRATLEEVGKFDQSLFRGEDVDYNWRLVLTGRPILFDPDISVLHRHRTSLLGLYRQQYMYGRAYVLVRSKWPEMYSVYPRNLRSVRSWAKLVYSAAAILFQPLEATRRLESSRDRIRAYPVLVLHHLIWKLGMLRQALLLRRSGPAKVEPMAEPRVSRWRRESR